MILVKKKLKKILIYKIYLSIYVCLSVRPTVGLRSFNPKTETFFYLLAVLSSSDRDSLSKPRNVVLIINNDYSM